MSDKSNRAYVLQYSSLIIVGVQSTIPFTTLYYMASSILPQVEVAHTDGLLKDLSQRHIKFSRKHR